MDLTVPFACQACERENPQIQNCRLKKYRFEIYNQKCPREKDLEEKAEIELIKKTILPGGEVEVVDKFNLPEAAAVKPLSLATPSTVRPGDVMTTNLFLKDVELGVFTPRMTINKRWVRELAEDIKRNGQQKAIIVQYKPGGSYPVIDGEHRVAALKLLRKKLVRAEVRVVTPSTATFLAMKINEMHGLRMDDFERGKQLFTLKEQFGWTQEELGKRFGRSQDWVSQRIGLYVSAAPELKNNVTTRVVTFTHAREISKLPLEDQPDVVRKVTETKFSSRKTKALVTALQTVDAPDEKQLVLDKFSDLDVRQAEVLTGILREKDAEERIEILGKTIEEIVSTPDLIEPGETIIQQFECPCGCGWFLWVNWEMKHGWWKEKEAA